MKLYCFLLLIILVFLVYDIKLYEGVNGEYDIGLDATADYQDEGPGAEESIFDQLGISDLLPEELLPDELKNMTSNTSHINCDSFENKTCEIGMEPHDSDFPFGQDIGPTCDSDNSDCNSARVRKDTCMNCLKCKDNYAFIDEFYARVCDTISGCYDNPAEYITDSLPYAYAYNNTNWVTGCTPSKSCTTDNDCSYKCNDNNMCALNPLQKITCNMLKDNSILDTMLLVKKPETALCHAEIATLDSPVGGIVGAIL